MIQWVELQLMKEFMPFSDTTITPKFTSLKQQLGDFIDYGIPPSTIDTP